MKNWTDGDQNRINKLLNQLDRAIEDHKEKLAKKIQGQIRHHYLQKGFHNTNVDRLLYDYKRQQEEKELIEEGYQLVFDGGDFIWVHPDSEEAMYYPWAFDEDEEFIREPEEPNEEELQQKENLEERYGEPGSRKIFENLELVKVTNGTNGYGDWTLFIWKKEDAIFKWFQSNKKSTLTTGNIMNVKGTIKEYKYFNKKFDIMLSRCTLYDTENNVISPEIIAVTRRPTQKKQTQKKKQSNKRKKKKSIKCSSCDKIFSSTQARNQHFNAKHGES